MNQVKRQLMYNDREWTFCLSNLWRDLPDTSKPETELEVTPPVNDASFLVVVDSRCRFNSETNYHNVSSRYLPLRLSIHSDYCRYKIADDRWVAVIAEYLSESTINNIISRSVNVSGREFQPRRPSGDSAGSITCRQGEREGGGCEKSRKAGGNANKAQ